MWASKQYLITAYTLFAVVAASSLFPAAFCALIITPKDVVAVVESRSMITCSTNLTDPVAWSRVTPEAPRDTFIYHGHRGEFTHSFIQRFSIDNRPTNYHLAIKNVQHADAGLYTCIDNTGFEDRASAQLTVIGKTFDCEHNIEETGWWYDSDCANIASIRMTCSINCTGSGYVNLSWYQQSLDGQAALYNTSSVKCSSAHISSSVEVPLSGSLNQTSFICSVVDPFSVNNSDSLNVTWTSRTVWLKLFGKLINTPKDVVAVVGSRAVIECSTDLPYPVKWVRLTPGDTYSTAIYQGNRGVFTGNFSQRFSIDSPLTNNYDLVIKEVQTEDAGQYTCIDDTGFGLEKGDYAQAQLTVIGKSLDCEHNIEETGWFYDSDCANISSIRITCSINCTGSGNISVNWYQGGAPDVSQLHKCSGTHITSSLEVPLSESLNQTSFVCSVKNLSSVINSASLNVTWTSPTVLLKSFPARRFVQQSSTPVGPKCLTESNNCKFEWRSSDGQLMSHTNELTNVPHTNLTGHVSCEANCPLVGNKECSEILVTILPISVNSNSYKPLTDETLYKTVWISVACIVVIIIIIIIIIVLMAKRNRGSRKCCINICGCSCDEHSNKKMRPTSRSNVKLKSSLDINLNTSDDDVERVVILLDRRKSVHSGRGDAYGSLKNTCSKKSRPTDNPELQRSSDNIMSLSTPDLLQNVSIKAKDLNDTTDTRPTEHNAISVVESNEVVNGGEGDIASCLASSV